ncbi:MAG: alanine racemase [SAR324 cluster bacterium]|nr:alanine racemase [SAR324 cluster bacterium]
MTMFSAIQRPTVAEINLDHLKHNFLKIRQHVNTKVMAIVKANAYGHGLIPVAHFLDKCGVDALGVAFLEEGIALRQAGIRCPILVLGGMCHKQVDYFLDFDLEINVSSLDKLKQVEEACERKQKQAVIHVKVDTGMERIGVHSYHAKPLIEAALKTRHCHFKGVFSHLACADDPASPMTKLQMERFQEITSHIEKLGEPMPLRHLANSGGILHFKESHLDMVRPGIILYGSLPDPASHDVLGLRPLLTLKSQVVYFKVIPPGASVSYGATWTSEKMTRVVTVPIGYGDGYPRALSSKGHVLIRGQRYPIIGRVCMDQFMVDIGWNSAWNEDEVVLIGTQGEEHISVEQIAVQSDTIPYEIFTRLNERIPRVYVGDNGE